MTPPRKADMTVEEAKKIEGVAEVKKAGIYIVLVVEPGGVDYEGLPYTVTLQGVSRPTLVIDKGCETHKRGWLRLAIEDI